VVNINEYLSSIAYAGYGAVSMLPASDGKVSYGTNFQNIWAGHLKEIGQQLIRSPLFNQRGKVIENVTNSAAMFPDYSMYLASEIIESDTGVDLNDR
jgi:hypothetical protein